MAVQGSAPELTLTSVLKFQTCMATITEQIIYDRKNIAKLYRAASQHGPNIGFSSFFRQPNTATLNNFYTKQQDFIQGSLLTLPFLFVLHCYQGSFKNTCRCHQFCALCINLTPRNDVMCGWGASTRLGLCSVLTTISVGVHSHFMKVHRKRTDTSEWKIFRECRDDTGMKTN